MQRWCRRSAARSGRLVAALATAAGQPHSALPSRAAQSPTRATSSTHELGAAYRLPGLLGAWGPSSPGNCLLSSGVLRYSSDSDRKYSKQFQIYAKSKSFFLNFQHHLITRDPNSFLNKSSTYNRDQVYRNQSNLSYCAYMSFCCGVHTENPSYFISTLR